MIIILSAQRGSSAGAAFCAPLKELGYMAFSVTF